MQYNVQNPILLLAFNRPDTAQRVFEQVRAVQPSKLYIAVDGPRTQVANDNDLCAATRNIYNDIDWPCDVYRLFQPTNLGCKYAVAQAITWFFEQEAQGIILEDDCLPHEDFFYFCDEMLQRYAHDTRIMSITGTNLQNGQQHGTASYYFSEYSHIWGWASWRRAWQAYDVELKDYTENDAQLTIHNIFTDPFLIDGWLNIFRDLKGGKIDSWDYQFNFTTFFQHGLCITPNVNLISNLGFREDATHTFNVPQQHAAALPRQALQKPLVHPHIFVPSKAADYHFLAKDFGLAEKWQYAEKEQLLRRRIKRWFKNIFRK
ncbi:hypothetical protein LX64_00810 [Chitinophaga skermanii]|uniref:Nucleotide-diphospho-sugar transferase n=1 Tax=Chitinophaga skermanii TaxID=331697 RepID=A0A327R3G9_9BACT|nr:hypothetical protein [Chitinophaga skermanii]RAJ11201.1 hypothetical protein LX64_00810 [Chitinophaga skermanii]